MKAERSVAAVLVENVPSDSEEQKEAHDEVFSRIAKELGHTFIIYCQCMADPSFISLPFSVEKI